VDKTERAGSAIFDQSSDILDLQEIVGRLSGEAELKPKQLFCFNDSELRQARGVLILAEVPTIFTGENVEKEEVVSASLP